MGFRDPLFPVRFLAHAGSPDDRIGIGPWLWRAPLMPGEPEATITEPTLVIQGGSQPLPGGGGGTGSLPPIPTASCLGLRTGVGVVDTRSRRC